MDPTSSALKAFSALCELSTSDLSLLSGYLEPQQFAIGLRITQSGCEAEGLLLVTEGEVRVDASGRSETRVAPLALGAYSLVQVGSSLATVTAETPCYAWRLDRSGFRRLADDEPRVACRLLEGVLAESAALGRRLIQATEECGMSALG